MKLSFISKFYTEYLIQRCFKGYDKDPTKMIKQFLIFGCMVYLAHGGRWKRWVPCGDIFKVDTCVCTDENRSEVTFPFMCMWSHKSFISHCNCKDTSTWNAPPGPCNDGSHNVKSCNVDDVEREITCDCNDGSTFNPMRGKMGGNGGRGRGRCNGRGNCRGRGGSRNGARGRGRGWGNGNRG